MVRFGHVYARTPSPTLDARKDRCMSQAFLDTSPASWTIPSSGRRPLTTARMVRSLWLSIAGLGVTAGVAALSMPTVTSAVAAPQQPSVATPSVTAAAGPFRLRCGPVQFGDAHAVGASFTAEGAAAGIVGWHIDYGDGQSASARSLTQLATHSYAQPGVYMAVITATTGSGAVQTSSCAS